MISEDVVQSVKSHVNIVDIIDQYVSLKKQGKNYFGFCPFHDERTPSFSVSEDKQIYKCFSCGRAGNVFSFFMEKDGLSFPEAVQYVGTLANIAVKIDATTKAQTKEDVEKDALIEMHELAKSLYHHILLHTKEGEDALAYLEKRGFTKETIETYQIGVSPASRHVLINLFRTKGYSDELIEKTGLVTRYQEVSRDRFFNRIMFPLRDEKGKCIAFSGRIYLDDVGDVADDQQTTRQARYLNSPETILFHKSMFIFNLDLARGAIRKSAEVILCEGYMDVISMWQAGIYHAVASMGTSLTESQIQLLRRIAQKILLAYDGDSAGQKATDRAIQDIRQFKHFQIDVLPLLDGMDPDEMIQHKGATYFREYVQNEQETTIQFYRRYYAGHFSLDSKRQQLDYIDLLLKQIVHASAIEQSMTLQELANEFHIDLSILQQQLAMYNQKQQSKQDSMSGIYDEPRSFQGKPQEIAVWKPLTTSEKASRQLLYRLLTNPEVLPLVEGLQTDWQLATQEDQMIFYLFKGYVAEHGRLEDPQQFIDVLTDKALRNKVSLILLEELNSDMLSHEISELLTRLHQKQTQDKIEQLKKEVVEASRSGDRQRLDELLIRLNELIKK